MQVTGNSWSYRERTRGNSVDEYQDLLGRLIGLADRVTMARLGLVKDLQTEGEGTDVKAVYATGTPEQWDQYLSYFRQTFAYLAASVRDGYAVLDSPARSSDLE